MTNSCAARHPSGAPPPTPPEGIGARSRWGRERPDGSGRRAAPPHRPGAPSCSTVLDVPGRRYGAPRYGNETFIPLARCPLLKPGRGVWGSPPWVRRSAQNSRPVRVPCPRSPWLIRRRLFGASLDVDEHQAEAPSRLLGPGVLLPGPSRNEWGATPLASYRRCATQLTIACCLFPTRSRPRGTPLRLSPSVSLVLHMIYPGTLSSHRVWAGNSR